jgi:hypothetical protein
MDRHEQEHEIDELIPEAWATAGCRSVWLAAFRAVAAIEDVPSARIVDLPSARAIFFAGNLSYQAIEVEGSVLDPVKIRPQMRETPRGTYLMIAAPFATAAGEGEEPRVRRVIAEAAGLISAINGGGLTFEFVFENIVDLESRELTAFSPWSKTPIAFGPARTSAEDFQVTADAARSLEALDPAARERVELALHWQDESVRAGDPRSEFISLWTALEALAMPDTTNIRPAAELLGSAYGMSRSDAASRFGLGRLQGFRSEILHGDALPGIHGDLVNYLRAIFTDLLLAVLGLDPQGRAQAYMESPLFGSSFDLDRLLGHR